MNARCGLCVRVWRVPQHEPTFHLSNARPPRDTVSGIVNLPVDASRSGYSGRMTIKSRHVARGVNTLFNFLALGWLHGYMATGLPPHS
ncbi:MAG: hypothetical protein HQL64_10065 [Magnetococcales bacterium]|nr:hypothetical protein [Magnetococcales bacterium]